MIIFTTYTFLWTHLIIIMPNKRTLVYSMIGPRSLSPVRISEIYQKFKSGEKIHDLYKCRANGINTVNGNPKQLSPCSQHAEISAFKKFCRKNKPSKIRRGATIITMRVFKHQITKEYILGNSKPCLKCVFKSLPDIFKQQRIDPKKINVVYYDGNNIVKTSYIGLTNSNVKPSSASKRLLR